MVQWLGLGTSTAVAQVQSLVGELRSRKLRGVVKIIIIIITIIIILPLGIDWEGAGENFLE